MAVSPRLGTQSCPKGDKVPGENLQGRKWAVLGLWGAWSLWGAGAGKQLSSLSQRRAPCPGDTC